MLEEPKLWPKAGSCDCMSGFIADVLDKTWRDDGAAVSLEAECNDNFNRCSAQAAVSGLGFAMES